MRRIWAVGFKQILQKTVKCIAFLLTSDWSWEGCYVSLIWVSARVKFELPGLVDLICVWTGKEASWIQDKVRRQSDACDQWPAVSDFFLFVHRHSGHMADNRLGVGLVIGSPTIDPRDGAMKTDNRHPVLPFIKAPHQLHTLSVSPRLFLFLFFPS